MPSSLKKVTPIVVVIDGIVAALTPLLIKAHLVPENVDFLSAVAGLFVVAGLILSLAAATRIRRHLGKIGVGAVCALLVVVGLQIGFVEAVSGYGPDAGTHRFVVGWELSARGQEWWDDLQPGSRPEFLQRLGDDRIPEAYGTSYTVVAGAYVLSYLTFVVLVVLAVGALAASESSPEPAPPEP